MSVHNVPGKYSERDIMKWERSLEYYTTRSSLHYTNDRIVRIWIIRLLLWARHVIRVWERTHFHATVMENPSVILPGFEYRHKWDFPLATPSRMYPLNVQLNEYLRLFIVGNDGWRFKLNNLFHLERKYINRAFSFLFVGLLVHVGP